MRDQNKSEGIIHKSKKKKIELHHATSELPNLAS